MSWKDGSAERHTMETIDKSELEDGEIEDETGSENDHFVASPGNSKLSMSFPSLMTMNVGPRGRGWQLQQGSGESSRYFSRSPTAHSHPQWGKYPASSSLRKRSLDSREFTGGFHKESGGIVKRRRDLNMAGGIDERRVPRNDNKLKNLASSAKKTRQSVNRKHNRRRSRSKVSLEKETNMPTSQDEYEALLRKHHEVQELIKQEEQKLTAEKESLDVNQEEMGGDQHLQLDRDKGTDSAKQMKSRSRSGSLKKDLPSPSDTTEEKGIVAEIVEVRDSSVDEIIEIADDEDDDELLQLRRLALESATKNVAAREEKENQAQKHKAEKTLEYKRAKQRERRRKVKQLFNRQSIAAEIIKVHGEKERFNKFMDFITSRRRSLSSSHGKGVRRSPSVGKESTKRPSASSKEDLQAEFQYDNYEQVEMDVSEMEESPTLTPVTESSCLTPDIIQVLTSSDNDVPATIEHITQETKDTVAEDNKDDEADSEDDDEDVMALREQLLRSLATKRAAKAQAQEQTEAQAEEYTPEEPSISGPTYEPSPILQASSIKSSPPSEVPTPTATSPKGVSSPLSTPRTQSPTASHNKGVAKASVTKTKPKVTLPPIPTHKPVVIQFDGESDSSDDEHSPQKPEMKQINFLDQFLKEARRTADAKKYQTHQPSSQLLVPKTPDAMHKLPEIHRAEYHKLKEEIARREQQRLSKSASLSGTSPGIQSPGTQSPVRDVTISVTKVDGKVQRTVVLRDHKEKDYEVRQDGEKVQVRKSDLPQGTAKESQEVAEYQASLTKHRLTAEKDCRILSALEKQIQKRHSVLKQTEAKLQQLREELAVGERIAASNRSQIKKYIQQKHLIQRKVQEHVTVEFQMRESLAKAMGVAVATVSPSQMLLQTASRLPKKTAVIGGRLKSKGAPNSPLSKKSETELQRLQQLEREYANQISKLREASAKRTKPAPNTVVRILKTKTKLLNKKPSTQLLMKDKIVLGNNTPTNTDSESDAEKFLRSRKDSKRRCSFLDSNPSLRPNLHARSQINQSALSKLTPSQSASSKSSINQSASKTTMNPNKSVSSDLKPTNGIMSSTSGKAPLKSDSQKTSAEFEGSVSSKPQSKISSIVDGMSIPSEEEVKRLRCAHAEKSKSALNAAILATQSLLESNASSEFHNYFSRKTSDVKMSLVEDSERSEQDDDDDQHAKLLPYSSPLLCFRSYRLSPFFVQEGKLSRLSPSFSHKLDPVRALCQFEINGTCNDDYCPWQHKKDYEMTDYEIYADLLSYTPLIATSKEWQDPEKRRQRVEDYINKAVKKSKRPEQAKRQREALCRAFANAVLTQTKKVSPGIIAQPRSWTPKQAPSTSPDMDDGTAPPLLPRGSKMTEGLQITPLGGGNQERYFTGEEIADFEAAVLETPGDVKMWIKLAARIIGDESEDPNIDGGLNALSRGLEANQSSSELWLQYLMLYSQRDDHGDLTELCQQALQFAPSYDLYWQCLSFEENFPAKDVICDQMLKFLQDQGMKEVTSQESHQLLDALLYRVQLHILTRRVKAALSMLQGALKGSKTLHQYLTSADHCLLWLVYIHMLEYQHLPAHLFDPTCSGLGHIVAKEPLVFQWGTQSAIQSAEGVRSAFQEAVSACSNPTKSGKENLVVCMPLYRNWVVLEQLTGRHEKAEEICQRLIAEFPVNTEAWMLLIDVHRYQQSNRSTMEQVLKTAMKRRSAALHNVVAKFAMQTNTRAAISVLKFCMNTFYTLPDKSTYEDLEQIRRLYCSLLGQSLPFDYSPPSLRQGVSSEVVEEQSLHLWLNYCLLQELTAEESVACEAYEQSLCSLRRTEDVQGLWMEYLLFKKSKLATSQDKNEAFRAFTALVNQCFVSMATEFPLPYSDKTWLDYSFHNRVVELYVGCLKDEDQLDMYERLIQRMPNNVNLAFRACHYASKSLQGTSYLHRVQAIATDVLNKFPECLPFWKIMISLSLHQERLKEAKMMYQQALEAVPLAANLWKDFFLLEVVHNQNPEDIRKLVLKCRELKVNIEDYLKTILK